MNITNLSTPEEHVNKAIDILSTMPSSDYLLMLSGGSTPISLYNHLSFSFNFPFPKDIALIDERWGNFSQHENSNELVVKSTGLLGRIRWEKSGFHPILSLKPTTPAAEAAAYEKELEQLFEVYRGKVVAIMGMGENGHIAGILPNSEGMDTNKLFVSYESGDKYGTRLTSTAMAILEHFSKIILLLNNEEKYGVFQRLMEFESDARKYPALILRDVPNLEVLTYVE
ncbi:6-phosphogluconolactonase [Patescibacteria group bacterium]